MELNRRTTCRFLYQSKHKETMEVKKTGMLQENTSVIVAHVIYCHFCCRLKKGCRSILVVKTMHVALRKTVKSSTVLDWFSRDLCSAKHSSAAISFTKVKNTFTVDIQNHLWIYKRRPTSAYRNICQLKICYFCPVKWPRTDHGCLNSSRNYDRPSIHSLIIVAISYSDADLHDNQLSLWRGKCSCTPPSGTHLGITQIVLMILCSSNSRSVNILLKSSTIW